jgi:large subunit ribosomal protein L34
MSFTYKPHKLKNKRKKGFLVKMSSKNGRKVINSRRSKGRKRLACA